MKDYDKMLNVLINDVNIDFLPKKGKSLLKKDAMKLVHEIRKRFEEYLILRYKLSRALENIQDFQELFNQKENELFQEEIKNMRLKQIVDKILEWKNALIVVCEDSNYPDLKSKEVIKKLQKILGEKN